MGLAGDVDAQTLEEFFVLVAEDHGEVGVALAETTELFLGDLSHGIGQGADGQRQKHLVRVEPGILMQQIPGLQIADRLEHFRRDQIEVVVDASHGLQRVEQQGGGGPQIVRGFPGDDPAVRQAHGPGGSAGGFRLEQGRGDLGANILGDARLLDEKLQLADRLVAALALDPLHTGHIVPAQDLPQRGLLAHVVVHDAEARHVDAHVRGGFIGGDALDLLENGVEHREDLHVTVIVDRQLAVGLQVIGVDHVHVVEIGGSGLIGQIDRVAQGQGPDGERLKFGIARGDAALVLVIELGQAGGHLAGAGARRRDHHQRAAGFNVVVFAKTLLGDHVLHVGGVALDGIVAVAADAQGGEPLQKGVCGHLTVVSGENDAAHVQVHAAENVDQTQHVLLVGDPQIAAGLVLLNGHGVDGDDDLHVVLELLEHPDLAVRLKARQDAGGVIVVKEFAPELQIQLAAELLDPLADVLGLYLQVFVVVKTDFHSLPPLLT